MTAYTNIEDEGPAQIVADFGEAVAATVAALDRVAAPDGYVATPHAEHPGSTTTIRKRRHNGHDVEVVTSYEFRIDGHAIHGHFMVDDAGRIHCHDLPNYSFSSALDMATRLVDMIAAEPEVDALNHESTTAKEAKKGRSGSHEHAAKKKSAKQKPTKKQAASKNEHKRRKDKKGDKRKKKKGGR